MANNVKKFYLKILRAHEISQLGSFNVINNLQKSVLVNDDTIYIYIYINQKKLSKTDLF